MTGVSRRQVLAGASVGLTASVAGCTASGDDDIRNGDVTIHGLSESLAYHDYGVVEGNSILEAIAPFPDSDLGIWFETAEVHFEDGGAYDAEGHIVLLVDGHDEIARYESPEQDLFKGDDGRIELEIPMGEIGPENEWTVVSKDATGIVEEVDITVEVDSEVVKS